MRCFGDERRFAPSAVSAPQVILIERLEVCADGNDTGARGVDGQSGKFVAANIRSSGGVPRSFNEGAHVVFVTLRGVVRVVFLAVQRIFGQTGTKAALRGIDDGDAHAQRSEIDAGYDSHELRSKLDCILSRWGLFAVRVHFPAEVTRSS